MPSPCWHHSPMTLAAESDPLTEAEGHVGPGPRSHLRAMSDPHLLLTLLPDVTLQPGPHC